MCQKREDVLVLLERLLIDFQGEGVVFEFDQRGKGVAVPQVQRVVLVLDHHVKILHPLLLVVEPREVLWRIGILINGMSRQIDGLLQSDARTAHHHLRSLGNDAVGEIASHTEPLS